MKLKVGTKYDKNKERKQNTQKLRKEEHCGGALN